MFKVTVQLKLVTPIIIYCMHMNDIVCETENICVYECGYIERFCKWMFRKDEIEYIKIERSNTDEAQDSKKI